MYGHVHFNVEAASSVYKHAADCVSVRVAIRDDDELTVYTNRRVILAWLITRQ